MKKIVLSLVFLLLFISSVSALTRQEYYTLGDDGFTSLFDPEIRGQIFRVGVNGSGSFELSQVSLKLERQGLFSFPLNVNITTVNADGFTPNRSNTISFNNTFNISIVSGITPGEWYNITLPRVNLTLGQNYSITVYHLGGDSSNRIKWRTHTAHYYPNNMSVSSDAGATWTISTPLGMFETYGDLTPTNLTVILTNPTNGSIFASDGFRSVTFRANLTGSLGLVNYTIKTYALNGSNYGNWASTPITGTKYNVNEELLGFDLGTYKWNVYACMGTGINSQCNYSSSNRTFTIGYTLNSETYEASVGDLINTTFSINTTLATGFLDQTITSSSASLYYNGTSYSSTKTTIDGNTIFTTILNVPAVSTTDTKNFLWTISLTDSSVGTALFNTTQHTQTITPSGFVLCDATHGTHAVNFSIFDEKDKTTPISSTFKATFNYNLGSTATSKNVSYNLPASKSYAFCINPNATYYVDSKIDLSATGYLDRSYNLINKPYTNVTTYQDLYLVNDSAGTQFIFQIKDQGLAPLEDYLVKVYRYYPENNSYTLVESRKTDLFGQIVAKLISNDIKYKIKIYDEDNILVKTTGDISATCQNTYCIIPIIIEDTSDDFDRFKNITNYEAVLSFNNNTKTYTFSWTDNTGEEPTHRLLIHRYLLNGSTQIYNGSSVALSGSLSFAVGDSSATYIAQGFRKVGTIENRIAQISNKVGDISSAFGLEGLMWAFLLLFTLVAVGSFWPPAGVGLYLIGFLSLSWIGVIPFSFPVFIANLAIGVAFIWAFRS